MFTLVHADRPFGRDCFLGAPTPFVGVVGIKSVAVVGAKPRHGETAKERAGVHPRLFSFVAEGHGFIRAGQETPHPAIQSPSPQGES